MNISIPQFPVPWTPWMSEWLGRSAHTMTYICLPQRQCHYQKASVLASAFIILIAPIFNTLTGLLHSFILTKNIYEVRWTDTIGLPPEALTWRLPYKSGIYLSTIWRVSLPCNQSLKAAASNAKLYVCFNLVFKACYEKEQQQQKH